MSLFFLQILDLCFSKYAFWSFFSCFHFDIPISIFIRIYIYIHVCMGIYICLVSHVFYISNFILFLYLLTSIIWNDLSELCLTGFLWLYNSVSKNFSEIFNSLMVLFNSRTLFGSLCKCSFYTCIIFLIIVSLFSF